ncbi:uncharacterized protein PV06_11518 [Exophiala oligosperma]|uniref:Uncharacterized protein n=1 Tax=Exophiala oligosperma TaxID=215243 RepID=A0A0D2DKC0_9EURO|nr:uncharacterized protein PV06_11518 [Exophiala oligosperma]KIW36189.1 hypothetical protein PV06_11518 [Exophiala oligosperma]
MPFRAPALVERYSTMDILQNIFGCFGAQSVGLSADQHSTHPTPADEKELARSFLSVLFNTEKPGRDLETRLRNIVYTNRWYEGLAKRILDGLVAAMQSGKAMSGAMKETYDKTLAIAGDFTKEHPVLIAAILTVVAIGISVILHPGLSRSWVRRVWTS